MASLNDNIKEKNTPYDIKIIKFSKETIEEHISELLFIETSSFQPPYDRWNLDNFLYKLPNKEELSFLLFNNQTKKVVGFLIGSSYTDFTHINRIALAPEYRGKGLGVLLTDKFINNSRSLGFRKTTLSTIYDKEHEYVIKFYEKQGYRLLTEKDEIIDFLNKKGKPQEFDSFYPSKTIGKFFVIKKNL